MGPQEASTTGTDASTSPDTETSPGSSAGASATTGAGVECSEDPNEPLNTPGHHQDPDLDGIGNSCDACPLSFKTGAVPDENCCDPRTDVCAKWYPLTDILQHCGPDKSGLRFDCNTPDDSCSSGYRSGCAWSDCTWGPPPCVPAGALVKKGDCEAGAFTCDCDEFTCVSKWCTVGDDLPCEAGMGCLAWFGPDEAPPGLADLGVCARLDAGPCAGKLARDCAVWTAFPPEKF